MEDTDCKYYADKLISGYFMKDRKQIKVDSEKEKVKYILTQCLQELCDKVLFDMKYIKKDKKEKSKRYITRHIYSYIISISHILGYTKSEHHIMRNLSRTISTFIYNRLLIYN